MFAIIALTITMAINAMAGTVPIPGFRAPAIPFITSDPYTHGWIRANTATESNVLYWDGTNREMIGLIRIDGTTYRWLGNPVESFDVPAIPAALKQTSVTIYPTRTVIVSELSGVLRVTVTAFTPMFTDDIKVLARPVTYVQVAVAPLDGKAHDVSVYYDVTGRNAVNNALVEHVQWDKWAGSSVSGAKVGSKDQKILGKHGDKVGINWGFAYLGVPSKSASIATSSSAGDVTSARTTFKSSGAIPDMTTRGPGSAGASGVFAVYNLGSVSSESAALFLYGYDDIRSIKFFGHEQEPYWKREASEMSAMMDIAFAEFDTLLAKAATFDADLLAKLAAAGGDKYATLCALAYRQTLAATKLTWDDKRNEVAYWLKEISSNGDMQTVDVIYPASPMFLYTNPELLVKLLTPLLRYANNETTVEYTEPFSPHEIGVYPIADHTTKQQEKMPMENTGNFFFMILGILQRNGGDASFFYPKYWNMLRSWANYLDKTLPYPQSQLCTDDFTGKLANNTNLAAKGIVALSAFANICEFVKGKGMTECVVYRDRAEEYAKMWMAGAHVTEPQPHTVISFNKMGKWSTKYNLLWQKILKLGDTPFKNFDTLANEEVAWYIKNLKAFGTPLDERNKLVKLDWFAWASFLATNDADYNKLFDVAYKYASESPTRFPLSDLYWQDSGKGVIGSWFVARPVVGALFAKALL